MTQKDTPYRVVIPHLSRLFSAKEPYNQWLFRGKKPATQGSLCILANLYIDFIHLSTSVSSAVFAAKNPGQQAKTYINEKHI